MSIFNPHDSQKDEITEPSKIAVPGDLARKRLNWAILLTGFILIGAILWLMWLNYSSYMIFEEQVISQLKKETENQAEIITYFINERRNNLFTLANSQAVTTHVKTEILGMPSKDGYTATKEFLHEYLSNFINNSPRIYREDIYDSIVMLDVDGEIIAGAGKKGTNYNNKEYWKQFILTNTDSNDIFIDSSENPYKIIVTIPIVIGSEVQGYMSASMPVGGALTKIFLLNKERFALSSIIYNNKPVVSVGKNNLKDIQEQFIRNPRPGLHIYTINKNHDSFWDKDEQLLIGWTSIDSTPFYYLQIIRLKEMTTGVSHDVIVISLGISIILILCFLLFWQKVGTSRLILSTRLEEQSRSEARLRHSEETLRTIFTYAGAALMVVDEKDDEILMINAALEKMGRCTAAKVCGHLKWSQFFHLQDLPIIKEYKKYVHTDGEGQPVRPCEARFITLDGFVLNVQVQMAPLPGTNQTLISIVDITDHTLREAKLEKRANYDALTGLPNRFLIRDRLDHAIKLSRRDKRQVCVMILDLDGFKSVNDNFGHLVGDKVLVKIGNRLTTSLRRSDTVGRWGGDEYIIIQEDYQNREDIILVAQKIIDSVNKPIVLDDITAKVGTSIGIAIFPDDAEDIETITRRADIAMYTSKKKGKNTYTFYDPELMKEEEEEEKNQGTENDSAEITES